MAHPMSHLVQQVYQGPNFIQLEKKSVGPLSIILLWETDDLLTSGDGSTKRGPCGLEHTLQLWTSFVFLAS